MDSFRYINTLKDDDTVLGYTLENEDKKQLMFNIETIECALHDKDTCIKDMELDTAGNVVVKCNEVVSYIDTKSLENHHPLNCTSIVGVRTYSFSEDEVASIVVCGVNMHVVVKTHKWLFVLCPKIEMNGMPLVVHCKDISKEYGGELNRLFRERVGIAVDESTFCKYSEQRKKELQQQYVDNYKSISSDTVKHWADRILNKTKMEQPNTVVIVKLDNSTFVQLINNKEHFLTQNRDDVFTFLYDGYDCQITSLYEVGRSSISTRLGALALDEVSRCDRYNISFQNRMLIGSIFRKYYEVSGVNPRSCIWDDLVL